VTKLASLFDDGSSGPVSYLSTQLVRARAQLVEKYIRLAIQRAGFIIPPFYPDWYGRHITKKSGVHITQHEMEDLPCVRIWLKDRLFATVTVKCKDLEFTVVGEIVPDPIF